eukprot:TRINITY_DN14926_c0_g1_i1.p1 TRINITY_DN14926_c0_g1~~TRINITY_DN14926_c0_g1_i1.p1  ORF type:complete len:426 (+),score=91.89 TRINITY_DN14926_c0_g1_i1:49-1278(+)
MVERDGHGARRSASPAGRDGARIVGVGGGVSAQVDRLQSEILKSQRHQLETSLQFESSVAIQLAQLEAEIAEEQRLQKAATSHLSRHATALEGLERRHAAESARLDAALGALRELLRLHNAGGSVAATLARHELELVALHFQDRQSKTNEVHRLTKEATAQLAVHEQTLAQLMAKQMCDEDANLVGTRESEALADLHCLRGTQLEMVESQRLQKEALAKVEEDMSAQLSRLWDAVTDERRLLSEMAIQLASCEGALSEIQRSRRSDCRALEVRDASTLLASGGRRGEREDLVSDEGRRIERCGLQDEGSCLRIDGSSCRPVSVPTVQELTEFEDFVEFSRCLESRLERQDATILQATLRLEEEMVGKFARDHRIFKDVLAQVARHEAALAELCSSHAMMKPASHGSMEK